jgi:hypothetical protein
MRSTEKVTKILDQLQEEDDEAISDAIPVGVPAYMLRGALLLVGEALPRDPDELDQLLDQLGEFALSLRSDP